MTSCEWKQVKAHFSTFHARGGCDSHNRRPVINTIFSRRFVPRYIVCACVRENICLCARVCVCVYVCAKRANAVNCFCSVLFDCAMARARTAVAVVAFASVVSATPLGCNNINFNSNGRSRESHAPQAPSITPTDCKQCCSVGSTKNCAHTTKTIHVKPSSNSVLTPRGSISRPTHVVVSEDDPCKKT